MVNLQLKTTLTETRNLRKFKGNILQMKKKQSKSKKSRYETTFIVKEVFSGTRELCDVLTDILCSAYRRDKEKELRGKLLKSDCKTDENTDTTLTENNG